jgi:hypothetical protein
MFSEDRKPRGNRVLKFLGVYLAVTGGIAAVALLQPGLVTLGFWLIIIPGLIMVAAPTAFLWGLVFTVCWLLARTLLGETLVTALVAGAATAALLVAVTIPSRIAGEAVHRASLLPEVTPANPIILRGDVRLDVASPRWDNENWKSQRELRGFSCDKICLALLFTPGVSSVTINKSGTAMADVPGGGEGLNVEARSYRLAPKSQCPDGGLIPDLSNWVGLFPASMDDRKAMDAEWAARLANDVCLVRIPTLARHDMLIRDGRHGETRHDRKTRWKLAPRGASVVFTEIRGGDGEALLRRFKSSVLVPAWPLHVYGNGNPMNWEFDWGLKTLTNQPGGYRYELLTALDEHSNVVGRAQGVAPPGQK